MFLEQDLLSALKQKKLLNEEQIERLKKDAQLLRRSAEDLIYSRGLVDEAEVAKIKSEFLKIPVKIFEKNEVIPREILALIPEEAARNYKLIVFDRVNNILSVAMLNPQLTEAQDALKFLVKQKDFDVKLFITTPSDLNRLWRGYKTFSEEITGALKDIQGQLAEFKKTAQSKIVSLDEKAAGIEEAPIIRLVSILIKRAVSVRASDMHIEPLRFKLRVRFRIDGVLKTVLYLPIEISGTVVSRIKIMSNLKIDETRIPQDGKFMVSVEGKEIDFRVSTFPISTGEKVAIRILDPNVGLKTIEELGLYGRNLEVLNRAVKKPFGMILVTGPTGSGKTTTLYSILQRLNEEGRNIISLEDPSEYFIEGVNQSQVLPEIGYTFARGLRQILRQDPDVIMVGEIRDSETAELAVHAALTGHIVLSTLHTNNAVGVIPRLIDLGVKPFLLPSSLLLMISQRLLGKVCQEDKEELEPPAEIQKIIDEEISSLPDSEKRPQKPYKIWQAKSDKCSHGGIKGRIGVFEMLEMTPELEDRILTGPSEAKILQEAKRQKMVTLRQDAVLKALEGIVPMTEVLRET